MSCQPGRKTNYPDKKEARVVVGWLQVARYIDMSQESSKGCIRMAKNGCPASQSKRADKGGEAVKKPFLSRYGT